MKRIEWPNANTNKDFVIVVLGDESTLEALQLIAKTKTVDQRKIHVYSTKNLNNISNIDLIYIGYSKRKYIPDIVKLIGEQAILLVSETKNNQYPDIELIEDDTGLSFMVNTERIRKKGLKISDDLIKLSKRKE